MKQILKAFKTFSRSKDSNPILSLIRSRKSIIQTLRTAEETRGTVGIYAPSLSDGLLLVGIVAVTNDSSEPIIEITPYDLNGIYIRRTQLAVSEIKSICAFDSQYCNPLLKSA